MHLLYLSKETLWKIHSQVNLMFANEALVKINGINYVMNQKEIFDITTKIVCRERKNSHPAVVCAKKVALS